MYRLAREQSENVLVAASTSAEDPVQPQRRSRGLDENESNDFSSIPRSAAIRPPRSTEHERLALIRDLQSTSQAKLYVENDDDECCSVASARSQRSWFGGVGGKKTIGDSRRHLLQQRGMSTKTNPKQDQAPRKPMKLQSMRQIRDNVSVVSEAEARPVAAATTTNRRGFLSRTTSMLNTGKTTNNKKNQPAGTASRRSLMGKMKKVRITDSAGPAKTTSAHENACTGTTKSITHSQGCTSAGRKNGSRNKTFFLGRFMNRGHHKGSGTGDASDPVPPPPALAKSASMPLTMPAPMLMRSASTPIAARYMGPIQARPPPEPEGMTMASELVEPATATTNAVPPAATVLDQQNNEDETESDADEEVAQIMLCPIANGSLATSAAAAAQEPPAIVDRWSPSPLTIDTGMRAPARHRPGTDEKMPPPSPPMLPIRSPQRLLPDEDEENSKEDDDDVTFNKLSHNDDDDGSVMSILSGLIASWATEQQAAHRATVAGKHMSRDCFGNNHASSNFNNEDDQDKKKTDTCKPRGILKVSSSGPVDLDQSWASMSVPSAPASTKVQHMRRVAFANIIVREYERTLGDNPSCNNGPALSIGWSYHEEPPCSLAWYESTRPPRRRKRDFYVSSARRHELLANLWQVSESDIYRARQEANYVQYCREKCLEMHTTAPSSRQQHRGQHQRSQYQSPPMLQQDGLTELEPTAFPSPPPAPLAIRRQVSDSPHHRPTSMMPGGKQAAMVPAIMMTSLWRRSSSDF